MAQKSCKNGFWYLTAVLLSTCSGVLCAARLTPEAPPENKVSYMPGGGSGIEVDTKEGWRGGKDPQIVLIFRHENQQPWWLPRHRTPDHGPYPQGPQNHKNHLLTHGRVNFCSLQFLFSSICIPVVNCFLAMCLCLLQPLEA